MNNVAIKRLRVAIVPSWLSEIVALSTELSYTDLLCFTKLLEEKSSILSEEQIIIYALTQAKLYGFTERAFNDIPLVGDTDTNAAFLTERKNKVSKIEDVLKVRDAEQNNEKKALDFSPVGIGSREYYKPLLVNGDTLLLIGSPVPVYQDTRAFYNALLESVGNTLYYSEIKQYEFFRYYLRSAVSN